jgi:sugar O-acyltransferase (sialic acid O-acetyltransferase NeuD family)
MIIAGAGGHAKELIAVISESREPSELFLFDDVSQLKANYFWNRFPIIHSITEAIEIIKKDPQFIIGVGNPAARQKLFQQFGAIGGKVVSVISKHAKLGTYGVTLGEGLNIMPQAVLTNEISIGKGTLVHINATIHHDCIIGEFCEISPGAHVLGKARIGDKVSIGAGAIVLPGVTIGNNVIVGAGSVVTRDIEDGLLIKGVPAK